MLTFSMWYPQVLALYLPTSWLLHPEILLLTGPRMSEVGLNPNGCQGGVETDFQPESSRVLESIKFLTRMCRLCSYVPIHAIRFCISLCTVHSRCQYGPMTASTSSLLLPHCSPRAFRQRTKTRSRVRYKSSLQCPINLW